MTEKYICGICGWIYDPEIGDPEHGVEPGTPFDEIDDDWDAWICPNCGAPKSVFEPYNG